MSGRGERAFANIPRFGARLYDRFTQISAWETTYREIAQDLVSRVSQGRLLDVGTGPGRLLLEIHHLNPAIELFGLDISGSMVRLAAENLVGIPVDLRQGTIQRTDYEDHFFDAVTCTGSFYLWDHPQECLAEISRVVKEGRSAYLYESYRDVDRRQLREAVNDNLRGENLLRRLGMPVALRRQLRMTYRTSELTEIVTASSFANNVLIEKITLARLPVWLRITLTKRTDLPDG